ncbi:MAG: M20/M25/M40 family metallo-hydrolase, partial [Gemmatimonadales bacterium]
LQVDVCGLKGGHSGVDIHLQRGNAIRILSRMLFAVGSAEDMRIARLAGGNARNAIPREARATIWFPDESNAASGRDVLLREFDAIAKEIRVPDPGLSVSVDSVSPPGNSWNVDSTDAVLGLLIALPHGVMRMSDDLPGLVETSTNLAVVAEEDDGQLFVMLNSRSSVATALEALRRRIGAIARASGASAEQADGYPSWQPNLDSSLLAIMRDTYTDHIGTPPAVGAMHAGLECGIIGEKYPGMDMVSFGPLIEFPHSPDERVNIDTVEPFFAVLCATLTRLARS